MACIATGFPVLSTDHFSRKRQRKLQIHSAEDGTTVASSARASRRCNQLLCVSVLMTLQRKSSLAGRGATTLTTPAYPLRTYRHSVTRRVTRRTISCIQPTPESELWYRSVVERRHAAQQLLPFYESVTVTIAKYCRSHSIFHSSR